MQITGWMDACMYVCMYVCTYVCMHACMHECMHIYICIYVSASSQGTCVISTIYPPETVLEVPDPGISPQMLEAHGNPRADGLSVGQLRRRWLSGSGPVSTELGRRTPHPVIVTIRDNKDYTRVLLYSYYTTITG